MRHWKKRARCDGCQVDRVIRPRGPVRDRRRVAGWQGVREHRGWVWVGGGVIALGAYGFVATLQPDAHFGRILAAYGGIFVAGSLLWGMGFDGFRPGPLGYHRSGDLPAGRRRHHVRAPNALGGQPQMIPQRFAGVLGAKRAALLQ